MAKSSNPFDMAGLYRAGYSSVYDPTKDKSDKNNAINTILGFAFVCKEFCKTSNLDINWYFSIQSGNIGNVQ